MCIAILFYILLRYGLCLDFEYISLCCPVRTALFILCIQNNLHSLIPNSVYSPPTPRLAASRLFSTSWGCVCFTGKFVYAII